MNIYNKFKILKKRPWNKILIFVILIFSTMFLGISYATWNSGLSSQLKITTGSSDILFKDSVFNKGYSVSITDINGNFIRDLNVDIELEDGEQEAKINFKEGLPMNYLLEGKFIKFTFPLEPNDNSSVENFKKTDFDPNKKDGVLTMKAEKVLLLKDSHVYSTKSVEDIFMQPLTFEVRYGTDNRVNHKNGYVYLNMVQDSINQVNSLPPSIDIVENDLVEYIISDEEEKELYNAIRNGITVIYSCNIPFYLEQR